jgi:hypothetical protein
MEFLRSVKPQVDWAGNKVRFGKHILPVCKYKNEKTVKSMRMPPKSRPSGCMRFSNTFELLNDLQISDECEIRSEVTPTNDVSVVERGLDE